MVFSLCLAEWSTLRLNTEHEKWQVVFFCEVILIPLQIRLEVTKKKDENQYWNFIGISCFINYFLRRMSVLSQFNRYCSVHFFFYSTAPKYCLSFELNLRKLQKCFMRYIFTFDSYWHVSWLISFFTGFFFEYTYCKWFVTHISRGWKKAFLFTLMENTAMLCKWNWFDRNYLILFILNWYYHIWILN